MWCKSKNIALIITILEKVKFSFIQGYKIHGIQTIIINSEKQIKSVLFDDGVMFFFLLQLQHLIFSVEFSLNFR